MKLRDPLNGLRLAESNYVFHVAFLFGSWYMVPNIGYGDPKCVQPEFSPSAKAACLKLK